MSITAIIIFTALAIMGASLVGVLTIQASIGRAIQANLPFLISFAAGVLLLSAIFLAREAVHMLDSWVIAMLMVLGGYLAVWLIDYMWPQFHHHHDEACNHTHKSGKRILAGDAIHNIADGLVLVPAFIASPIVGLGVAVSIFTHELLQELSEFFVLKQAGYSTTKALLYNFLVASTILIGVAFGLVVAQTDLLQGILLALSAGFFINIVLHDLLPHHHGEVSRTSLPIHVGMIVVGMALIGGVNQLFAHSHDHGTDHDHAKHMHESHTDDADHAQEDFDHNHDEHTDNHDAHPDLDEHLDAHHDDTQDMPLTDHADDHHDEDHSADH